MRCTATGRTRMLASDATTPSLTSSVTRSDSTRSHYNRRNLTDSHDKMPVTAAFRLEKVAEAPFPTRWGDLRSYELPGAILRYFELTKVRLLSNNPEKVEAVERAGVEVVERIPCLVDPVESTEAYLRTKKDKMGHLIDGL